MSAEYEYLIVKKNTPDELTEEINKSAAAGWEPINAYSCGDTNNRQAALLRLRLKA